MLQLVVVLFYEETLSDSSAIQHAYSVQFPKLVDAQLGRENRSPLSFSAGDDRERLDELSRQIVSRTLVKRDLVVTGSCLAQTTHDVPIDLYFYLAASRPGRSSPQPDFGARGIALADHPHILMDVLLGSGSIYPVFPSRTLRDFPEPSEAIELIDGGFAHNSPLEAAILWGASHIILLQASPEERETPGGFLNNARDAFQHLYSQAQRIDAQTKAQVAVFTLAPSAPHLCVLDFADNLVEKAIEKGYREARGEHLSGGSFDEGFRKELGEPRFWNVR